MGAYIGGSGFMLLMIGAIWVAISQLRDRYAPAVHTIWYLFSFSIGVAWIVLLWAQSSGAVDSTGNPKDKVGAALMDLLKFSLDLTTDFYALSALVALIIGPQVLSYCLSGLFGCASRPRLMSICVNFFAWGMAKSFTSAAGILLTLSIFGAAHGWKSFDGKFAMHYSCFAMMLLAFAFVALMGKVSLNEIPLLVSAPHLEPLRGWLRKIDQWMVRHRNL